MAKRLIPFVQIPPLRRIKVSRPRDDGSQAEPMSTSSTTSIEHDSLPASSVRSRRKRKRKMIAFVLIPPPPFSTPRSRRPKVSTPPDDSPRQIDPMSSDTATPRDGATIMQTEADTDATMLTETEADDAMQTDTEETEDIEDTEYPDVMLVDFLRGASLPACQRFGHIPIGTLPKFVAPWPDHPELKRRKGTRALGTVKTYDTQSFLFSVEEYIRSLDREPYHIVAEESMRLRIPSEGFLELDEDDIERYSLIDGIDQLMTVIEGDVLKTVRECIRIIEQVPVDATTFGETECRRATHLCTAHHARWDILIMCLFRSISMVVVVVPPWEVSEQALTRFTWARDFPANILDTLPANPADFISDKLWAVVYDACYDRCGFFVVTNYTHWVFGQFGHGWKEAAISEPMKARTISRRNVVDTETDAGTNVLEFLVYWTQFSRNRAGPVPVVRAGTN